LPAHISHELFAQETFDHVFDEDDLTTLNKNRKYWVFGAQGPDFFLHNHRTQPSGLIFGKLIHNERYGDFVYHLLEFAIHHGRSFDSPLGAYILGFVTHAILDRKTHPFINYFSGWVERDVPESIRYTNCHAFLERIIDVFLLKMRHGTHISDYDFLSRIDLGESPPADLVSSMVAAIESTYPEYRDHDTIAERVTNAYFDTMNFYRYTNPPARANLFEAWKRDKGGIDPTRRFLALFHPDGLPELDYLNIKRASWNDPGDSDETRDDSFLELYEQAIDDAAKPVRIVANALLGIASAKSAGLAIGNENLSDEKSRKTRRDLRYVSPLPLDEVLSSLYAHIGSEIDSPMVAD
jgi:hypothetical protein